MAYSKRRYHGGGKSKFNSGGNGGKKFGGGRSGGRRFNQRGPRKENIHPSKFIKKATLVEQEEYKATHKFADFKIAPLLHKNLLKKRFSAPSPIQDQSIPVGLKDQDVIGIANTGTGKTIAFAIPVIHKLLTNPDSRVLIMAPTRELAQQILDEVKTLVQGGGIYWAMLIGGASMNPQLRDLARNPRIVVGTPGRIKDHLQKKKLNLSNFNMVVLDEVDRMLDMGFAKDMEAILSKVNKNRQSFFFSATMNDKIKVLINKFSNSPVTVSVKTSVTSDNVEQNIVKYASPEEKMKKLQEILNKNKEDKILIFDDTKRNCNKLFKELNKRRFKVDVIHGNKSQNQRQRALNNFKKGKTRILVATDVAARGIDVENISYVVNYSTPQTYDDYTHRIGRAGRAGKIGHALTFIPGRD
jgi:ATP-dependent RNA helicase RhlE